MSQSNSAGPSRGISPSPSTHTASNFTPLPRSLLAGTGIRFSPTPPPEDQPEAGPSRTPVKDDLEPGQIKENSVGGGIFIDDIPQVSPPPLPDTVEAKEEKASQKQKANIGSPNKGKEKAKEDAEVDSVLLLPSHVLMDLATPSKNDQIGDEEVEVVDDEDLMEGVHFVDDDISRGSKRYFDPEEDESKEVEATFLATADQSKICQNCKRPGHRSKDCKHIICTTCGAEDSHERRDCPVGLVCFGCGGRGHRKQDCPDPLSRMSRRTGCDRCGSRDHMENTCHTIWRVYAYLSNESRAETIRDKVSAEGWEKEAIGGRASEEWCYNCAREGHLGDDCAKRRGSLARLTVPSAFSQEMASRGPFFDTSSSSSRRNADLPPPTHSRFNDYDYKDDYDNLPFISGGYQNFGGSSAGKKTREKERNRQMQLSRNQGSDDEPSWFNTSNRGGSSGLNIRGRGGMPPRGGGGGFSTPVSRNGIRRPWDSEYRERDFYRENQRESEYGRGHGHGHGRDDYDDGDRNQSISARSERYNNRNRSRSPPPRQPISSYPTRSTRRDDSNSMPFSHGHLMDNSIPSSAPAKVISFGRLSEPGSNNRQGQGSGAKALINRALGGSGGGNQSTPTGKNKNIKGGGGSPLIKTPVVEIESSSGSSRSSRKKKSKGGKGDQEQNDRDWESEWRKDGRGGGKVSNWGKELDQEMKDLNTSGGGGGGLKIKGRSGELNAALGGKHNIPNNNNNNNNSNRGGGSGGGGKGKGKVRGGENGQGNKGGKGGGGGGKANTGQRYHGGYD